MNIEQKIKEIETYLLGFTQQIVKGDLQGCLLKLQLSLGLLKELQSELERYKSLWETNCEESRKIIAELKAKDEWQPIETAPKDGEAIFLIYEHLNPNVGWEGCEGYFNPTTSSWSINSGYTECPQFWKPLPKLPKQNH